MTCFYFYHFLRRGITRRREAREAKFTRMVCNRASMTEGRTLTLDAGIETGRFRTPGGAG